MTIYSLDVLLSQFGTHPLFHVQFFHSLFPKHFYLSTSHGHKKYFYFMGQCNFKNKWTVKTLAVSSHSPTFSMRKTFPCLLFICLLHIYISSYVERDYMTNPYHIMKSLPHSYTLAGTRKTKGTFWSPSVWERSWLLLGTFSHRLIPDYLGLEITVQKEMANHSSILAWEIRGQRSLAGYSPWGHKESDTT